MRFVSGAVLLVVAGLAIAAEPVMRFDQAQFEQRFRKADTGNKGRLSRAQAYAEFPRMPQYFDEIDKNRDGFITLDEVKRARERRVDAAIDAGRLGKRYGGVAVAAEGTAGNAAPPEQPPQFSSSTEARRYYRLEYYESVAGSNEQARQRGEPAHESQPATILKKSF